MKRLLVLFIVLVSSQTLTACSVYMAATQPGQKDLSLLRKGQPRAKLIAEYGSPQHSEMRNGQRVDIFSFVQGYHGAEKAGRAVLHGAADVVTLGLWEAVGTPVEGHFNGTPISAEVTYDAFDTVLTVRPLKGEKELMAANSGDAAPAQSTGHIQTGSTP